MTDYEYTVPPTEPSQSEDSAKKPFEQFVEHQKRALDEANKAIDALIPPGFKEHGAEAQREFVKGFKVLVDAAAKELDKTSKDLERKMRESQENSDRRSSTGPTKVKVQVE